MKWIKAALIGALGALVTYGGIYVLIQSGAAPYNVPPVEAFVQQIGLPPRPLGAIVHFLYGMFWSIVLVGLFPNRINMGRSIGLALVLWLVMMVIYSPMLEWGVFGIGGSGHQLPPDHPLYLGSSLHYILETLVMHLIYGAILAFNPLVMRTEGEDGMLAPGLRRGRGHKHTREFEEA